jgi:hypothetical protein
MTVEQKRKIGEAVTLIKKVLDGIDFDSLSKYDCKHLSELKQFADLNIDMALLAKIKRKTNLVNNKILSDDRFSEVINLISRVQDDFFGNNILKEPPSKIGISEECISIAEKNLLKYISPELFNVVQFGYVNGDSNSVIIRTLTEKGVPCKDAEKYVKLECRIFSTYRNKIIGEDLGLEWYMYVGSNLTTTREFCEHLTKKKYVHKSEIPTILEGDIDGHQCRMNKKTGLPFGLIEGTNTEDFIILNGGWNCGHQLVPVAPEAVPENIKKKLNENRQ